MPTLSDIQSQAESGSDAPVAGPSKTAAKPNQYCLETGHSPQLLTENRFFFYDPSKSDAPDCPVCGRKVSAQLLEFNSKGEPLIPRNLLSLADRIGEAV